MIKNQKIYIYIRLIKIILKNITKIIIWNWEKQ